MGIIPPGGTEGVADGIEIPLGDHGLASKHVDGMGQTELLESGLFLVVG